MKFGFKRMLALVLCAAMVFGMLPMQQVKAEDDYFIGGFIANNTAELVEALTEAERLVAPEKLVTVQIGEPFELTENVSVPGGCRLDVPVPFTIGEGVTMAVSGDLEVVAEMSNKGTLKNNGNVTVYGNAGGSLAFAPTGKYTGTGEMMVINSTYEDIIPGMDLSKVNIEQGQGIGGIRWIITAKEDAELVPDQWGNYSFRTMEELKQLASKNYDSWTWANYAGEEPFVIDESISLPRNLPLGGNGAAIEIAEGVVVDVHEGHFDKLVVNGTLNIEALQVYDRLDVNGILNISGDLYANEDAVLNGMENVSFANGGKLGFYCNAEDVQQLKEYCAKAVAEENSGFRYIIYLRQEMTLDEDMTVPANVQLSPNYPLTISEGATLTLECEYSFFNVPITVKGALVNNGWFSLNYPQAVLTIAEGATYSGNGAMIIHGITDGDPMKAVPGIDLTGYELVQWDDQNTWQITPEGYIPGGDDNLTFSNVEELKELISQGLDPWTSVHYVGEGPLVINETIVCPEYLMIHAARYEVRIGENGNLTVQDLYCDKLIVEGTLNVATVDLATSLNVTGTMNLQDGLLVLEDTVLNGLENVRFQSEGTKIFREYPQVGKALFLELVEQAMRDTDSRWIYSIYQNEEIVLDQDLVVPNNVQWYVDQPLNVAAGVTLAVNCYNVLCSAPVTIEGALENNSWFTVWANRNASVTFAEGSSYTGSGTIAVEKDPSVSLESVLPGLDLSNMYIRQDGDNWCYVSKVQQGGGNAGLTFSSMEELKELASQTHENWTWAHYTGSGTLVIDESIVIPENLPFECPSLEIAAGVTVNAPHINADKLVVNGTLNVGNLNAYSEVTVNGSMLARGTIHIQEDTVLNGQDKIRFANDWAKINIRYFDNDLQGVKELFVQAEQETNPRIAYSIYLDQGEAVVAEDLTVSSNSSNVYFYIQTPLTVQEGVTLTFNNSQVWAHAPVTVKGNLENNTWLYVATYNGATLTFAEGSSYSGGGTIAMEKDPSVPLESVLPGLDLSNLFVTQDGDWWWYVTTEPFNPGGGGYELSFASVEELKELASQTYDNWIGATYTGNGPLVIDETIVCPEYLMIHAWEGTIQITENGSLRVDNVYCDTLIIEGVLNSNYVVVVTEVDITGTLNLTGTLNIDEVTDLNGWNNIRFLENWACVDCDYQNVDKERMLELVEAAYASTNSRWIYSIYPDTEGQIILDQDLTLPENTTFHLNMPMTVAEGCTLTLNCRNASLYSQLTVEGNLINNTWTELYYDEGGLLTIAEGGSYSGSGTICILANYMEDPSVAVPGLDLSQWETQQDGDWWHIRPIGGGGDNLTFSTLEELKALAAESYDWGYMVYTGTEDFVISEDISMPVNTYVDFDEGNLIINEGTTAAFCQMSCADLTVDGNLIAEYADAMGDVVVRGTIKTMGLNIGEDSEITGLDNIKITDSYSGLVRIYYVNSGEKLAAALNKAANPKLPKEKASIQFNGGPVILTEDATLPKNCEMYISSDMVIAEGATLTINGRVSIGCPLVVKGTLVNNNDIYTWDSKMIIAEGGEYEGRGTLRVLGGNDYNTVFQGLNLEDFQITNNYGEWRLVYVVGLPSVAAPSELEWGYTYDDGVKVALPGAVSWKSGITDTTGVEYVYFYRINEDGTEILMNEYGGVGYDAKNYMDGYNSSLQLLLNDIPSGKYYFTVYSQGDYKNTKDSETVTSPVWEYTRPTDRLDTATDLGWSDEGFRAEWTNPNSADEVHYALVSWYYKNSENGYEYTFGRFISQDDEFYELRDVYLAMMGTGYYRYAVQFVSADIAKSLGSELSAMSDWYHLEKMPETPTAQLGGLLNDPDKTNEEKLEEVQNMGTDTLKEIMEENSDAMDILVQLETVVSGGSAQVDVSAEVAEEIAELGVEEISIVGANLNSKEDDSQDVTLVIDKVEEVREITGNYDTSTAVQFSMTLDNVKDTKNLEVPVVVTIPVPAGIAADKVVVLHYHDDGTYDVINPEVSIVGGKTYATFILTSFSDFAILEKLAALLGDMDGNSEVNVDDVLALLWYVLFPDDYPLGDGVAADLDHADGVNVDDVLTLLWYVLFPDAYPLS